MDYTIMEQFALVALDGQDSIHNTAAKKAAVIGIAAASVLQTLLVEDAQKNVNEFKNRFCHQLEKIKKMNGKQRRSLEKETVSMLKAEKVLEEVPNLLGCDMNYYTANVTMREYKTDEGTYQRIIESVRAVILEPGEVPEETVAVLWLFRECGCFHDIFSIEEQKKIESRLIEISAESQLYKVILEQEFHSGVRRTYLKFLNFKSNIFKNPYLEGVNLLFPFFDRRQAIFIDMVILGTTVRDRRQTAMQFLRENGHSCEELRIESETMVKIDNAYYRIWPSTRSCKVPIQGVELLPVYR
ncbi:hypothetical protein [Kineothrix sedimenti]|uniref:DUF3800 domain-containing protein n=1 Tax=Kineothrix sedimenti TaxID=3123317 RepID=A0ABZ3F1A5_9FIRM